MSIICSIFSFDVTHTCTWILCHGSVYTLFIDATLADRWTKNEHIWKSLDYTLALKDHSMENIFLKGISRVKRQVKHGYWLVWAARVLSNHRMWKKNHSRRLYISIQKPAAERDRGRPCHLPSWSENISFKDDVTVILLRVSFMVGDQSGMHRENIRGGQHRCRHYISKREQLGPRVEVGRINMSLPPPPHALPFFNLQKRLKE